MAKLYVTTRDGTRHEVQAESGLSIMENVRNAGITDMVALCGGTLSCATCHVYIGEQDLSRLPLPAEDEQAMLEVSEDRRASSRLSCQLQFGSDLDGLAITIAP